LGIFFSAPMIEQELKQELTCNGKYIRNIPFFFSVKFQYKPIKSEGSVPSSGSEDNIKLEIRM
jgi:hypothetical protein